jgi:hypothetical protein
MMGLMNIDGSGGIMICRLLHKKPKKLTFFGLSLLILSVYTSCGTTISIRTEKPPYLDMQGVEKITVMPFEFTYKKSVGFDIIDSLLSTFFTMLLGGGSNSAKTEADQNIADYINEAIKKMIVKETALVLIDQKELLRSDAANYSSVIDIYIAGQISKYRTVDHLTKVNITNSKGEKNTVTRTDRSVTLEFTYRIVRVSDGFVLKEFEAQETESSSEGGNEVPKYLESSYALATKIIDKKIDKLPHYFAPWILYERRELMKDEAKDKRMKEAKRHAEKGNYNHALEIYHTVYMETGNTSAGYNAAIMAEALGNTGDAIEIMKKLVDNARYTGDYWRKAEYYLEQLVKNVADAELLEIYNAN